MPAQDEQQLTFSVEQGGERLDRFLAQQLADASRVEVQRWIKEERVTVNGRPGKASAKLATGNVVALLRPARIEAQIVPEQVALAVVYEDADLLVVNKPAGMVVHPAPGHVRGTLVNALLGLDSSLARVGASEKDAIFSEKMASFSDLRAGIVHRLDRETSGLLLVARNDAAFARLQRQFKSRRVQKTYLALVEGVLDVPGGRIEAPVARDPAHRQRMAVLSENRGGRKAATAFRVLDSYVSTMSQQRYEFSLLEVDLLTGRTHQIRVHMAFIKHPVVGDRIYGRRKQRIPCPRQFLHAARLVFTQPSTGEPVEVEAPLPADLQAVLDHLRALS
ncbi:MAG TPA: RluA family pseudouridine synthase [Anaerolineae bacterium]|nr:RluA family pseudouridine synthase [Anaerolineae bacterium]